MDPTTSLQPTNLLNYLLIALTVTTILVLLKKFFNGGVCNITTLDLKGKYAVITGGNSGIGAQTTKFLARNGCSVIIGARDRTTAEQVIKECIHENPKSTVEFIELNLASRQSIKFFADGITFPRIDFLINNAGVMAIPTKKTTQEGLEMQWAVNHLGHFYLTYLLWNKVLQTENFRVVNLSSLAHKRLLGFFSEPKPEFQNINFQKGYEPNTAYSRSKLYNVLFTRALASKINPQKGKVVSVHPGVVRTNLLRQMTSEGVGKVLNVVLFFVNPIYWFFTKSSWQGCQTTLHALFSEQVQNGSYYADCQKDRQNSNVTSQNWNTLWDISEQNLGITFKV